jgi:hypothetical protein
MGPGRFPANEARNEIPNPIGASIGPVRAGHYPVRDIAIRSVKFSLLFGNVICRAWRTRVWTC